MISRGEFKGKKTITLLRDEGDRFPFTFGLTKARLIIENLEEIKKFVDENSEGE
jgi:hypothetical protein